MKLANLFHPFRRRKAPPTPRFWVQSRYDRNKGYMSYAVTDDIDGEPLSIFSHYRAEVQEWAVLLNAGLLQLPVAEAEALTIELTAVRMSALINCYGPESFEMPPDQDEQFDPPQPEPPKPDLYSGDPFPSQPVVVSQKLETEDLQGEATCRLIGELGGGLGDMTVEELEGVCARVNAVAEEAARPFAGAQLTHHSGYLVLRAVRDALQAEDLPLPSMHFDAYGILQMDFNVLLSPEAAKSEKLIDRVFSCAAKIDLIEPAPHGTAT